MSMSPLAAHCLAVLTPGLQRVDTLSALLSDVELRISRRPAVEGLDGVLAWGRKPSARVAEAFAARYGLPVWRAEDGFLRSVGLGNQDPPLSIVLDDLGIYYDATSPSRIEAMIARRHSQEEHARAAALRDLWREGRLSKYNHARELPPPVEGAFVLVVDQTRGDASIAYGQADAGSFTRMLEAALDEHPHLPVVLKVHPDVIAGHKRGHFDALTPGQAGRVHVLGSDTHPCAVLEAAEAVYTVTSQMGFEALLWGRPVRCFGMPFYAGWGLTGDELPAPERRRAAGLDDLVHAALVEYPRYLDPETGKRCEPERLMQWMALQRRMRARFPQQVYAMGFSSWKKPIVRAFFGGSEVRFVRRSEQVPPKGTLAVWGRREVPSAEQRELTVVRLEDGFLRSVGLGAELARPLSWVMDCSGIYYDATAPSDLERLLATATFDAALLARARALRERIVAQGITKYNVGKGTWARPASARHVVLVPGQVESDASIRYGAPLVKTNLGLLHAVRSALPDSYVLYKPHPDVVAGLRLRGAGEDEVQRFCDEVVMDVPMEALLAQVDEVHVLRGRTVVTYGCPFYAGWGLTRDLLEQPRRGRRLKLDELVAGVLILYPSYVSRTTGLFTSPERALDELLTWKAQGAARLPAWRRLRRWVLRWFLPK
jgi:capsular polysaccharide export protein